MQSTANDDSTSVNVQLYGLSLWNMASIQEIDETVLQILILGGFLRQLRDWCTNQISDHFPILLLQSIAIRKIMATRPRVATKNVAGRGKTGKQNAQLRNAVFC